MLPVASRPKQKGLTAGAAFATMEKLKSRMYCYQMQQMKGCILQAFSTHLSASK